MAAVGDNGYFGTVGMRRLGDKLNFVLEKGRLSTDNAQAPGRSGFAEMVPMEPSDVLDDLAYIRGAVPGFALVIMPFRIASLTAKVTNSCCVKIDDEGKSCVLHGNPIL